MHQRSRVLWAIVMSLFVTLLGSCTVAINTPPPPVELWPFTIEDEPPCLCERTSNITYITPDPELVDMSRKLAQLCHVEYNGTSDTQVAMVCWCVLNRVTESGCSFDEVITQPGQFGYSASSPVDYRLYNIARDVVLRWRDGGRGRVLPEGYTQFRGDGYINHFYRTCQDADNMINEYDGYLGTVYDS